MEQDRWIKESEPKHKSFKSIIMLGLVAVVIIGISILSCGKTKVKSLSFDKGFSTLKVDATDKIYVTIEPNDLEPELVWKSTDESVASVLNGVVTGHKAGEATITAIVKDQADISADCKYLVEEENLDMQTLDILEEPIVLRPGGHQQMNVSVTPENQNEEILWSSSDESVARVSPRGKVEAIKIGVAYIIAKSDRTGVTDSALVSVEGTGVVLNMATGQAENSSASPAAASPATASTASKSVSAPQTTQASAPASKSATATRQEQTAKPVQTAKPAQKTVSKAAPVKSTPVQSTKPVQTAKPAQNTVSKAAPVKSTPVQSTKPVQTAKPAQTTVSKAAPAKTTPAQSTKSAQTTKPVTQAPAKSSTSGMKNLGYANFRGSWPNDVNGRMEFKSTHVIDSKDPKNRMASPGDYVIGEWSDGHLVQGIWYGSDNQVKGSILIGK